MALRLATQWTLAKVRGYRFDAFDAPPPPAPSFYTGNEDDNIDQDDREAVRQETIQKSGKFF